MSFRSRLSEIGENLSLTIETITELARTYLSDIRDSWRKIPYAGDVEQHECAKCGLRRAENHYPTILAIILDVKTFDYGTSTSTTIKYREKATIYTAICAACVERDFKFGVFMVLGGISAILGVVALFNARALPGIPERHHELVLLIALGIGAVGLGTCLYGIGHLMDGRQGSAARLALNQSAGNADDNAIGGRKKFTPRDWARMS